MLKYCQQLENGNEEVREERRNLEKIFRDIVDWYISQHREFEHMLQNEMVAQLCKNIQDGDSSDEDLLELLSIQTLSNNWSAKLNLYSAADIMCLQLLSKFTPGPGQIEQVQFKYEPKQFWRKAKYNVNFLYEMLQLQLENHNMGGKINLAALKEERSVRSALTHNGQIAVCLSAIRSYNVLREMIILMDDELASQLPAFRYPAAAECDMQQFMHYTNQLNFNEENTVLVVGSLHDISAEAKTLLANLPWTLVLDLDGYTDFGGLRSCLQHNCVQKQLLTPETAERYSIPKNYTTWYTCGEFCDYAFCNDPGDVCYFTTKTAFEGNYYRLREKLGDIFSTLMNKLSGQLKPINILFIHGDTDIASILLQKCAARFGGQYTFTALYYQPQDMWTQELDKLNPTGRGAVKMFDMNAISCDLDSFFAGLLEYRNAFPTRQGQVQSNLLPSEDGNKQLPDNLALNLNMCFDVLYADIGQEDEETAQKEISQFYHGGVAPWSAFKQDLVVPLMRQSDYQRALDTVRHTLRRMPEIADNKIINLVHEPGIGGSTLLRQIGWDLHQEYPTLILRKYDSQITQRVMKLYDEMKRGVLILADETAVDVNRLKDDIRKLPRACALVVAGRLDHLRVGRNEQLINFRTITSDSEERLKNLFKQYSTLTRMEKSIKDEHYQEFVNQSAAMRCPFMIGLYYLDRDFNGVKEYVDRILGPQRETREIQAIAMIALCDYYGQTGIPRKLIDNYLTIPARSDYLRTYTYATSAFLAARTNDDVPIYRAKHHVISGAILDKCCQLLYGSDLQNSLSALAELIIDVIYEACSKNFSVAYQDVLERLFVDKNMAQYSFSRLIMDIAEPTSRKYVLERLAESFGKLAKANSPETTPEIYRMAAHFYGHLGRLCSKREGGVENMEAAKAYGAIAVELMESASAESPDPLIYHMYAESCKNGLRQEWERQETPPNSERYRELETEIDQVAAMFDKAAEYGEEEFAFASKLDMFIKYLRCVYKWKDISTAQQIGRLSSIQAGYRSEIEGLLNLLEGLPISEETRAMCARYENEYRSDVMMNDYGSAISYYENLLSNLQQTTGHDVEKQDARRGLISIRMARYDSKAKSKEDTYAEMDVKELTAVLDLLEQTLAQPIQADNYRQRNQRINGYRRWFQLAKMRGAGRSIHTAQTYAQRWDELASQSFMEDPQPVYYRYVLAALQVLDGNLASRRDMNEHCMRCYELARKKGYSTERIKDVLVEGTGLERLLDMRYAKNPMRYLESAKLTPMVLEGRFEKISGSKGIIRLDSPINWAGQEMKFTMGEVDRSNTVGQQQLTHKLGTMAGFSFEQMVALNQSVRDYSAGEPRPSFSKYSKPMQSKPKFEAQPQPITWETAPVDNALLEREGNFIYHKITNNGGMAGVVEVDGQSYLATLTKSNVTDEMAETARTGGLELPVMLMGISPQGDRYLVRPL